MRGWGRGGREREKGRRNPGTYTQPIDSGIIITNGALDRMTAGLSFQHRRSIAPPKRLLANPKSTFGSGERQLLEAAVENTWVTYIVVIY